MGAHSRHSLARSTILTTAIIASLFLAIMLSSGRLTSAAANHSATGKMLLNDQGSDVRQAPGSVIAAFDAALNTHDADSALALFADNAVVTDTSNIACLPGPPPSCYGSPSFETRVQIRGWLERLVQENVEVTEPSEYQVLGENVTWAFKVSVDEFRRLGVAPLLGTAEAIVEEDKISSLNLQLDAESTAKLLGAYAASERSSSSLMAGGMGLGVVVLGLIFPGAAIYYVSRVKKLFTTVPRLDKPWILLGAGVASLFVSVLLVALRDIAGMSASIVDSVFDVTLVICAFFIMSAMILMKRVMISEPDE